MEGQGQVGGRGAGDGGAEGAGGGGKRAEWADQTRTSTSLMTNLSRFHGMLGTISLPVWLTCTAGTAPPPAAPPPSNSSASAASTDLLISPAGIAQCIARHLPTRTLRFAVALHGLIVLLTRKAIEVSNQMAENFYIILKALMSLAYW